MSGTWTIARCVSTWGSWLERRGCWRAGGGSTKGEASPRMTDAEALSIDDGARWREILPARESVFGSVEFAAIQREHAGVLRTLCGGAAECRDSRGVLEGAVELVRAEQRRHRVRPSPPLEGPNGAARPGRAGARSRDRVRGPDARRGPAVAGGVFPPRPPEKQTRPPGGGAR